jgi:hypothetical protein
MAEFKKGQTGNKRGRPKTAHLETVGKHQKTQQMITEGTNQLALSWPDIIDSLIKQAVRGNVPAATWLRDTFIGKPSETINHNAGESFKDAINLAYKK